MTMAKGQIISGGYGKILIRQKSKEQIELGELLISETKDYKILLQVYDLVFGSQISQQNLELISGINLEEQSDFRFMDPELRNYIIAIAKNLLTIKENKGVLNKTLPAFFSEVREVEKKDLVFIEKPKTPLYFGKLRSGSKTLDVDIFLNGENVFSHHILVAGTTGRGKSVLMSNLLWDCVDKEYCGILVLDPHDEYFGKTKLGLKDHPERRKVIYYSPKNVPPGQRTLKINLQNIRPSHFNGVMQWSDPQNEALNAYYRKYGSTWIEAILLEKGLDIAFNEATVNVVKRRLLSSLDLQLNGNDIICRGVFDITAGTLTIADIVGELESGSVVIVDTSGFDSNVEILIGSLVTSEIFRKYKKYKIDGTLKDRPVISIILEEAPRVLGKDVLERGPNIFSTIAREGRKFKIGLTAITQLPSLIPKSILANMNTKIILGVEMKSERLAIIESASQDLSDDDRNIASLDIGEAIITSNFARFAIPIKVPLFEDVAKKGYQSTIKTDFGRVGTK